MSWQVIYCGDGEHCTHKPHNLNLEIINETSRRKL